MASKTSKLDHLARVPLFDGCSRRELTSIAKAGDEITMTQGTLIIDQGQMGREAFVVLDGQVTVKRGQFIFFTERCVHGSGPNDSKKDRLAFNFRVVPTNVPAYPDKKYYRSVYNGGKYHLDKWGVVLLRGEDKYKLSRTIPVETLLPKKDKRQAA